MNWATWTTEGVHTGPAGIGTVEGGVLKGELAIHTTWVDRQAIITAQYSGATDWYTIAGSPVPCLSEQESRDLHQAAVDAVRAGRSLVVPTAA